MGMWLLKTEPEEWSWQDQAGNGGLSKWDGVRNGQAQKYLKAMEVGDLCLFYHSGKKAKEIVGYVRVVRPFYTDPSDSSAKYGMVDVCEVSPFSIPVNLATLKAEESLKECVMFRQPRLSVVPVSEAFWNRVLEIGHGDPVENHDSSNIRKTKILEPPTVSQPDTKRRRRSSRKSTAGS